MESEYSKLLRHPKWQRRRLEVMQRDGFKCCKCGGDDIELHVHHKRYIKGRKPWDYEMGNFQTLCKRCHFNSHNSYELVKEKLCGKCALCIWFKMPEERSTTGLCNMNGDLVNHTDTCNGFHGCSNDLDGLLNKDFRIKIYTQAFYGN
jgi:hypothetical protein